MDECKIKKKRFNRDSIIGLGEESFRKNYYPELQRKIYDLEKTNARNKAIISSIPDILLVSDLEGNITPITYSSSSKDEILNSVVNNIDIMKMLSETIRNLQENQSVLVIELKTKLKEQFFYFEARFQRSESDEILIMIRDMTKRILMEQRLIKLAQRDNLTNLYNRRSFEETLNQYNRKMVKQIGIISIDINGLKFINDTLGHLAGDKLIVNSAKIISEIFEDYGHVSRIGGDEFAVILENIKESQIKEMLSALDTRLQKYNASTQIRSISLAYGYSYHKSGFADMEYMFQIADNNMYQNKLLNRERAREAYIKTFMKDLEIKDYIAQGHIEHMEQLAVKIGKKLKLNQGQLRRLILLIKYHDIGKIGISDTILNKPDKLTEDEWKMMKTHSFIGERIAKESTEIKDISLLILHHHERWDGSGYPLGVSKEEIPIECRIFAIIESFDVMTNVRPYSKARSAKEACKEIVNYSGIYYDPNLVDAFCQIKC